MSGEPLRGPSMIFFLEGGVVKIFFFGGPPPKRKGAGFCASWTWNGALSKLSGLPTPVYVTDQNHIQVIIIIIII